MKFSLKREWFPLLLVVASITLGFYFYAHFPDRVPIHWNFRGQPDGWGGRFEGAFIGAIVLTAMYILFLALPYIDPKRERYESFFGVYQIFKNLLMAALFGVFLVAGLNGLGYNISVRLIVPIIIGLMFMIIGNYMGKLKMNWFVGVRTPWALSSEEVWTKTNRFGGRLMIIFGLIMIVIPFLPDYIALPLFIVGIAAITFGSFAYSYIVYRGEQKKIQ